MNAKRQSRRAIAMIRVSKERDGMTSPDVQRHAIEQLAQREHIRVIDWTEGIDESGSRAKSAWWPRLDAAIDRIEAKEADVILVWKFSRTGRNRLRWAIALDRVDSAGGAIISATEPIESKTASGRFARGMLGEMNAYQADLIGETWREAHERRVRSGMPANGKPRFGYAYTRETGFTPDPDTAPTLSEAYRRYIGGESVYSLVQWLNNGPTRPVGGYGIKSDGLWSDRTLRRVLDSGFAAGLIRSHGELYPGAHEPIITPPEWDAYQEARTRRRTYRRTERSEYTYSGMVWCQCGSKMHAGQFGSSPAPKFRCKDAHEKRTHEGGYVTETVLDTAVRTWLNKREAEIQKRLDGKIADLPRLHDPRPALERKRVRLAEKQDQLAERAIEIGIPMDTYERLRDKYRAEFDALTLEIRTLDVQSARPTHIPRELIERWGDLEVAERREMLRSVIGRIVVTPQRPVSKVDIFPHG